MLSLIFATVIQQALPTRAVTYGPVLVQEQRATWPKAPEPWTLGGLVEQETCISLTHSFCWNPKAELRTAREYGFGFGQLTIAYDSAGKERFNRFAEMRAQYEELRTWQWADRYNPNYQLRGVVLMVRDLFGKHRGELSDIDRWQFTLSGYNGGWGGINQDRLLCKNTRNCDPTKWFDNVEHTSRKSRRVYPGYRQSPFAINREYVKNVWQLRRAKYKVLWDTPPLLPPPPPPPAQVIIHVR